MFQSNLLSNLDSSGGEDQKAHDKAAHESFGLAKRCFANDRIIPKISNDGQISGTMLMINAYYTEAKTI